jgi:hypothetical protein
MYSGQGLTVALQKRCLGALAGAAFIANIVISANVPFKPVHCEHVKIGPLGELHPTAPQKPSIAIATVHMKWLGVGFIEVFSQFAGGPT